MQKFLDFISSKTFRNIFCFFVFSVLMTAAISSQNFFFQKVIENGISKRDIIAQKTLTVIDVKRTEQHRKEFASKIEPVLTSAEDEHLKDVFEYILKVPQVDEILSPVIASVPLQLLAYYIAEFLGKDVDQPRNLAKSVTVE